MKEPKKPLKVPVWAEWMVIGIMLALAGWEAMHREFIWAGIFGVCAVLLGMGVAGMFGRDPKEGGDGK